MRLVRPRFSYIFHLALLLAAASARPASAASSGFEGKTVVTVQFVPETQPLEASELYTILPLKKGQPLRIADVRATIERLYATGYYKEIQVDAEPHTGGVIVRILTKNSWFIGNISVSGHIPDPPNAGQLLNASRLNLGQPFVEAKLKEAINGQELLLRANGLHQAQVRPVLEYDSTYQQVHIRFEVESGKRARYTAPVVNGELKLPEKKVIGSTHWSRWLIGGGRQITQTRTRQGLDGILKTYQKANRLEAKVTLDSMDYDENGTHATPNLTVEPGPRIQVNVLGTKISRKTIQRYVPIYEERTVDHDLLVEGAHNLRDHLQAQGYFEADVEFKQQRVANDKAGIDYLINTGRRHRLVYIGIEGNRYFDRHTIRERMFLEPATLLQFRHGRYSGSLLRRDEESIVNLYLANGFLDVKVTDRVEDNYRGRPSDIAVYLTVAEGPQYFVNTLQVEGIEHLNRAQLLAQLGSAEGQPFSEFNVAVDRDTILTRYFAAGFPGATFEWSSRPAAQPHRIDLRFVIHEGEQQFVRQVLVSGLKTTRQRLVDNNLRLNPGDPLSPIAITDTQRRLYDLGVFARVDTAIQNPDGSTPTKYVLYEIDEASRYSLAAGLGAEIAKIGGCQTCLEAPAGQAGFFPRVELDLSRNNLWGLAHSLSLRGRASNLEQRALVNYNVPRFQNHENLALSFTGLYDLSRDIRTFSSKRQEGSVQLGQRFSKTTSIFYRYTYRRVSVDEGSLKITPFLIPLLSQPVRVGIVSLNVIHDRRDDQVDPHKGLYSTIDIGLAEKVVGSQRNYLRFLGRNSSYHPIGRKLVFARSIQFGNIYSFKFSGDPMEMIPLAERFFGGGASSMRGFQENQAGPRDLTTGFPLGGTAMLANQFELRFPLIGDNVGGVIFHDAGNTYSKLGNVSFRVSQRNVQDFDYMVHAVGFGIRYRTPVGPLRVDLGYSINAPNFIGYNGSREELLNAGVQPCNTPGRCTEQNAGHFQFFFSIGQTF